MAMQPIIERTYPKFRFREPEPYRYQPPIRQQETNPKALGNLVMFPINRRGRLEAIAKCREFGISPGCTVARRSILAGLEGNTQLLAIHEMGIVEWNLTDVFAGTWYPIRVEWLSTPTHVTYERPEELAVVEN